MVGFARWLLLALAALVACDKSDDSTEAESDADTDADADTDTDVDQAVCGDANLDPGEDCDDGGESKSCDGDCTAVECGDATANATAGEACDDGGESETCNLDCTVSSCGDGVTNATAGEECDAAGESADCNANCTIALCGDGIVNAAAGEICEPTFDAPWDRCPSCDHYGSGLDGTFGTKWEAFTESPAGVVEALQSFHYAGTPYLYDFYANLRYEIATDTWSSLPSTDPVKYRSWIDGAVDAASIWIPAGGSMYKFDLATETWTTLKDDIPNNYDQLSAAVFDGDGYIWYHGTKGLVRYDPNTRTAAPQIKHDEVDVYTTRMAYDPIGNRIAFGGYQSIVLMIYDIAKGTFTTSSKHPGGSIRQNSCGDNAGGMYVGSDANVKAMYRYDVAADTFTPLPLLPARHDLVSTCVVSQDGYLYVPTDGKPGLYRLALGTYAKKTK